MLFKITNQKEQQQIIQVQTHKLKYYQPTNCIQKFTYLLVRPPRLLYNEDLLIPNRYFNKRFTYKVYYIPFPLSLYQPEDMTYVVLYLHGNSSCRLQGFSELSLLPENVGLACFDFDGCGNRLLKKYISIGRAQATEVDIAASYLKSKGYKVVGWGRSMGSVSLLLSNECQVLVADSPYSSLRQACYQHIQTSVPKICKPCISCIFPCLQFFVNKDIKSKIDLTLQDFQLIKHINQNKNRSIMFLAASNDVLIDSKHALKLHQEYQGRKEFLLFQGDHNSQRPIDILQLTHTWIQNQLQYHILKNNQMNPYKSIELFPKPKHSRSLSELGESRTYLQQSVPSSKEQFVSSQQKSQSFKEIARQNERQTNFPEPPDQL